MLCKLVTDEGWACVLQHVFRCLRQAAHLEAYPRRCSQALPGRRGPQELVTQAFYRTNKQLKSNTNSPSGIKLQLVLLHLCRYHAMHNEHHDQSTDLRFALSVLSTPYPPFMCRSRYESFGHHHPQPQPARQQRNLEATNRTPAPTVLCTTADATQQTR